MMSIRRTAQPLAYSTPISVEISKTLSHASLNDEQIMDHDMPRLHFALSAPALDLAISPLSLLPPSLCPPICLSPLVSSSAQTLALLGGISTYPVRHNYETYLFSVHVHVAPNYFRLQAYNEIGKRILSGNRTT